MDPTSRMYFLSAFECDRSLNGFGFLLLPYLDLLSIGTADESELATNKVRLLDYETLEQCQSAPNFPIALEHRDISQTTQYLGQSYIIL